MGGNRWHGGESFDELSTPYLVLESEMYHRLRLQYGLPQRHVHRLPLFEPSDNEQLTTLLTHYPWLTEGMSSDISDISPTTNCVGQQKLPLTNSGGGPDKMRTDSCAPTTEATSHLTPGGTTKPPWHFFDGD
jgi:hypothetical protein